MEKIMTELIVSDAERQQFDLWSKIAMDEYSRANDIIHKFDEINFKVKSWSITLGTIAIGAAYSQGKPKILLIGSIGILLFWLTEALFKSYQRVFIERMSEIEHSFKQHLNNYDGPEVATKFRSTYLHRYHVLKDIWENAMRLNVLLPHLVILVLCVVFYLF
jgi:hypothetical protein